MSTNNSITLKLMVDKSRNQVVYAEADAKFVDILLSFLILPVGTILSVTNNKLPSFGSFNNLYQSVLDLDDKYFMPTASKAMLLQPSNSAEEKFRNLALQIDGSTVVYYYVCNKESCHWELMSPYPNVKCPCGASMGRKVKVSRESIICEEYEGVFVKGLARFMISDDWVIKPASTDVVLSLLETHGIEQVNYFQEKELQFGPSDVIRLLRCSFDSNTAFTDAFLAESDQSISSEMKTKPRIVGRRTTTSSSTPAFLAMLKLFVDKKDKKVIYAECDEQLVDFLFRFLTLPMGSVVKNLEGNSHISCYDNLYNSVVNLAGSVRTISRDVLIDPKLPQHLCSMEQFIEAPAEAPERFYMCRKSECESTDLSIIPNAKCQCGVITNKRMKLNESISRIIKSAKFMVTDDLVVTPLPSISVITLYLMKAKGGVEEIDITIGKDEALALLQAAMISKTVLTDAFMPNEEVVEQ